MFSRKLLKNLPHAAELHSNLADLRADLAEFVSAPSGFWSNSPFAIRSNGCDPLERRERNTAHDRRKQNGNSYRSQRKLAPRPQRGSDIGSQQARLHCHPNDSKRDLVAGGPIWNA